MVSSIRNKVGQAKNFFKDKNPKDYFHAFQSWFKQNWPVIKKKATSTEGIRYGVGGFILLFIIFSLFQSCAPRKGTLLYGICGAFLELHIPYPSSLYHARVEQYRKALRIYYNHTDSFGQYQREMIECAFIQDPEKGVQLETVFIDHIKPITKKERTVGKGRLYQVEQKYIDLFNLARSPAAIMSQDPDLSLPPQEWKAINY